MNEKRQHRLTQTPRTPGEPKVRSSECVLPQHQLLTESQARDYLYNAIPTRNVDLVNRIMNTLRRGTSDYLEIEAEEKQRQNSLLFESSLVSLGMTNTKNK